MSYLPIIATEMIFASAVAIVLYWWDKQAAQKNGSARSARGVPPGRSAASGRRPPTKHARIAEANLLLVSLVGGWPGAWWASQRFRHKTKKLSFRIQFWIVVLIHIAAVSAVLWYA